MKEENVQIDQICNIYKGLVVVYLINDIKEKLNMNKEKKNIQEMQQN